MGMILIFLFILSTVFTYLFYSEKTDNWFERISSTIITLLSALALITYFSIPKAMDVYKGKTTLEITYKDNVAIDSIVVFK